MKPQSWGFESGFTSPDWEWFWRRPVGVWAMWDRAGLIARDLSQYGNHGAYTVAGGDGGFAIEEPGSVATLLGGDDFIDTGTEGEDGVGLFADSSQQWTLIVRFRSGVDENNTLVARAGSTESARTLQIFTNSTSVDSPGILIRGSETTTSWGLDDDEFHTMFITWDGTTGLTSYEGLNSWLTLNIGTASENTGQRIIFGARTNGAGFLAQDLSLDYVAILPFVIDTAQKNQIGRDPHGMFERHEDVPAFVPVVGGVAVPVFHHHYASRRAA